MLMHWIYDSFALSNWYKTKDFEVLTYPRGSIMATGRRFDAGTRISWNGQKLNYIIFHMGTTVMKVILNWGIYVFAFHYQFWDHYETDFLNDIIYDKGYKQM